MYTVKTKKYDPFNFVNFKINYIPFFSQTFMENVITLKYICRDHRVQLTALTVWGSLFLYVHPA